MMRELTVSCGEQHTALDDELVGVGRHAEPCEPALDDVEGEEFLGRSSFCPGPVLQVEVSLAGAVARVGRFILPSLRPLRA